jgi:hypothetical protein
MKAYICQCCGGTINPRTMKCEYCDTPYKMDYDDRLVRIETYRNPVDTIAARTMIPDELIKALGPERASERAVNILVRELSECISQYMVLESEYRPAMNAHMISARMKVVVPKEGIEWWKGLSE